MDQVIYFSDASKKAPKIKELSPLAKKRLEELKEYRKES
jgi:hypothetical protein